MSSTDEVIALERQLWERADDPRVFEMTVADDAVTVMEPMGFMTKQQGLKMVPPKPWTDVQMQDLVAREVAPGVVTLAYHGMGKREDMDKPYRGSVCSTYVKRDGRWQLVLSAHQPWDPEAAKKQGAA